MVIEIVSASSVKRDRITKFQLYQNTGVREYWIVEPDARTVQTYRLENGKYVGYMYGDTDVAPVGILESCKIDLTEVFAELE